MIFHVPVSLSHDAREITWDGDCGCVEECVPETYAALKTRRDSKSVQIDEQRVDSWGAQFHDDFQPLSNEVVIRGVHGFDAFTSSDLDYILRHRGVRNVVVIGIETNLMIQSTVTSAYEKGYEVISVSDACACTSSSAQEATILYILPNFSKVKTADDVLVALKSEWIAKKRRETMSALTEDDEQADDEEKACVPKILALTETRDQPTDRPTD